MTSAASRPRWDIVALAVGAGIVVALHLGKTPPALPAVRDELSMSLVMAGWVASATSAVAAAVGIAFGLVADRIGRRLCALLGLVAAGLASLGGAFVGDPAALMATRLVEGLGFVLVAVSSPGLIAQATAQHPPAQRFALGAWGTYVPAGMAVAMVVAAAGQDWRSLWIETGLFTLAFALLFGWLTADLPNAPGRASLAGARRSLTRPGPWLMAAIFVCYALQWFGVMIWLPTFATESLGLGTATAALVVAGVVFVNALGNLMGAAFLRRGVARWRTIAAASLVMGIAGWFIFAGDGPAWSKFLAAASFSMLGGMLPASILAGTAAHAASPAEVGLVNGIIVQGAQLGQLVGPPALAIAVEAMGGWSHSSLLLGSFAALAIALALWLRAVEQGLAQRAST